MSGTENRKAETAQKRQRMQELVDLLNQAGRAYYQGIQGDHEQLRV